VFGVVIAVVFTFAVAGVLYAEYGAMSSSESTNEFDRCTMTCTMLMQHYNKNFAVMKAHEGDKQCWQTCWRVHNDKSGTVAVGGWRSAPRTVVCAQ
jgi:hypothetical protein